MMGDAWEARDGREVNSDVPVCLQSLRDVLGSCPFCSIPKAWGGREISQVAKATVTQRRQDSGQPRTDIPVPGNLLFKH
jgi:hypothetical protein